MTKFLRKFGRLRGSYRTAEAIEKQWKPGYKRLAVGSVEMGQEDEGS